MAEKNERQARFHGRIPGQRSCDHPGCTEAGEFRAPPIEGSRAGFDGPGAWRWLCLDHVRAFNAGYNFFNGMTAEEISAQQRPYAGWERETRAFAAAAQGSGGPRWTDFVDPLDAIQARFSAARPAMRQDGKLLSDADRRALKVLALDADADRRALRTRYAELVRRYHPDRNGGDRSHEKALQDVIEAYNRLKSAPAFA
ncbi:J domain-containing protein [Sphingomonas nostoxanthinifaciens]|uniref:J domain-containing protein n=1 Tax=Sphingomonas nostoxanthinifaciens TaxID=2872652 RepID=UPI001CC1FB04|nr:J domain-containing protein [Sphingomonas nostoxanthinifaciens]UAK24459.1 J domain-containing protein [Sphingomonas nostoxanthinifaciens]